MSSSKIIHEYLFGGAKEILALTTPVSPLEKRDLMRIEKRYDKCSSATFCPSGYHCISTTLCKKNVNYVWTAVFGVLLLLCICICFIRRRRAREMAAAQQTVAVNTFPQQGYAPPAGDPNLAYQTPATYPPPAGAYAAPPTDTCPAYVAYSAPYTGKPGETYSPLQAPPAAYNAYPPASGSYMPVPAPYSAVPSPEYTGAYPAPATTQSSSPYPAPYSAVPLPEHTGAYPAPATAQPSSPYPVPQGEAASYAPPVHH